MEEDVTDLDVPYGDLERLLVRLPSMDPAQARHLLLAMTAQIKQKSKDDGLFWLRFVSTRDEADPDHPVNRGTLCPKGAGLLDFVHSESRLKSPEYRAAGSNEWKRISWDEAFTRIARHMKADRDKNFITTNDQGVTVNRWNTTGLLASSAASNETGYLTVKAARGLGIVTLDTQARI